MHVGWQIRGGFDGGQLPALVECLDRLAEHFGADWVDEAISHPFDEQQPSVRTTYAAGPTWDPYEIEIGSTWAAWTVAGTVELRGTPSLATVRITGSSFELELAEGWAEGCLNEQLVADLVAPVLASLRSSISWRVAPTLHPILIGEDARAVLALTDPVSDLGWDGTGDGPFPDQSVLDLVPIDDNALQTARSALQQAGFKASPTISSSAFLLPTTLASLAEPVAGEMMSFFGLMKGRAAHVPTLGDAEVVAQTSSIGTGVRITLDRRYGMRDSATADAVWSWFNDWIQGGQYSWAILTPIASAGSALHHWLDSPVRFDSGRPPIATWLLAEDQGGVQRHGVGPFPTRSALDSSQERLGPTSLGEAWGRLHPLDQLALPSQASPDVVHATGENLSASRRELLGELFADCKEADRPWTLQTSSPHLPGHSLCLSAEDWERVARLVGPEGFDLVASCMAGLIPAWSLVTRGSSQVEPLVSFFEDHGRSVEMVPGVHGPLNHQTPHRRRGTKGPLNLTRLELVGVRLTLRLPTGERLPVLPELDAATLVSGVLSASKTIPLGALTIEKARRRRVPTEKLDPRTADVLDRWFESLATSGIDPQSTIEFEENAGSES